MIQLIKRTNAKERLLVLASVLFIVGQVWMDLKVPDYMSQITTLLQTPNTAISEILKPGGWMILLSLMSFVFSSIVGLFAAKLAASLTCRLRQEMFGQVLDYSTYEIQQFSIPSLTTRTTNDLTQIQQVVAMGLQVMIKGPITAVWAVLKIAGKNWQWTTTTGVAVLILLIMLSVVLTLVQPRFAKVQQLTDKVNSITRENLTGLRVVRAYNAEDYQEEKFEKANQDLTATNLFAGRVMALLSPGMSLISGGLTLAVYWIGAYMIQQAQGGLKLSLFSDMIVFSSYAMQVVMSFVLMSMIFMILPRATVSARRINEVLTKESSVEFPTEGEKTQPEIKGTVEFDHVSFSYPDASEPVIHDISFKADQGDTVAFIGSTGSGKSTILNLIPRFYETTEGNISIDEQPINTYSHVNLNDIVGYIPQKPILFSGTIQSNLDFGTSGNQPLNEEKMQEALSIAQASEFVNEKEGKLKSPVAQNGSNFSGGQKQRLAIARVIARQPEILLFDDSFSALDYKTDKKLRQVLKEKLADTTKLIVAQRISTIMDADQILVLDEGRIVGQGTHDELLTTNSVYQEIAYSQLSKEELVNG
ncbi:ABC transporter ATP-binding protein [Enterococcus raffinosus]|uniref:ABC transporter ATP-binding protein n=1 Tax=Enterococcus raffinosus TaxID=71452 RepID=A0AAW8T6Q3_9ENTE|nr:ABC transporter ATP-binding protein [Enterococcus raffinosus]MDT2523791.1 ABC transporter ATP-binding protein [Enterococcus raffinosus]MDT2529452.1 ABC transporter ATP-binding protein [Enterococcus raffinosus]MDT2534681.1 ABC transporter ATP-binding protein [Enterococcus raffinosus]MDT2544928.1 ABC transporter ATP-binding protein [Enterococcus raffinosus]MDT2555907.1 ABC transporter ATP-binding protein [Enterococcus raffinosus]